MAAPETIRQTLARQERERTRKSQRVGALLLASVAGIITAVGLGAPWWGVVALTLVALAAIGAYNA